MKTIGKYEVLGEITRGGQGVVYRAFDPVLHDQVAIKVLLSGPDGNSDLRDSLREARIAVRLDHPNIVRVRDANEDNGRLYMVMELLTGRSLDLVLASGELSVERKLKIAIQICEGLHYAHSHEDRVIHRDIKPKNIMVLEDERVKIIDFGIAKSLAETRQAGTGGSKFQGWGTIHYMSPEQVNGDALDQRTDIFSFGVVLYEMLAKRRPFTGRDDQEIANKIRLEVPSPVNLDDPALQTRVRRVVDRCLAKKPEDRYQDCGEIRKDIARLLPGAPPSPRVPTSPSEEGSFAGKKLGRYRVLAFLGAGAMGDVYKAEDTENGNTVALKFLKKELVANPGLMKRFVREGQAGVQHPNVCQVFGCEEHDGQIVVSMEYCEGVNLLQRLEAGPLQWEIAVQYCIDIADGLEAIHKKDIVHRDIKPTNIIVKRDGAIKIVDFGVAKFLDLTALTESGFTVGTPAYMSPEQTLGKSNQIDTRSDIWALGVVLYELVSGVRPFPNDGLAYAILNEDPKPLPPSIPPSLRGIIGRALEKDPARRYTTAAEMGAELRRPVPVGRLWQKIAAALGIAGLALLAARGQILRCQEEPISDLINFVVIPDADCKMLELGTGKEIELTANNPDTLRLGRDDHPFQVFPRDYPCFDTTFTIGNDAKTTVTARLGVAARFGAASKFSLLVNGFYGESFDDKIEERVVINRYPRKLDQFSDYAAVLPRGRYRIRFDVDKSPNNVDIAGQPVGYSPTEPDVFDFSKLGDETARITMFYPR